MPILEEFKQAIELQQNREDADFYEQMELSLQERIAKGVTISNVKVQFDFYEDTPSYVPPLAYPLKYIKSAQIFCQNNISKFREGAIVKLSKGAQKFKMEIIEDSVEKFILAPNNFDIGACFLNSGSYDENNWEINDYKSNLTLTLFSATANHLINDPNRLDVIEKLLNGNLHNPDLESVHFSTLNDSQNYAIKKAYASKYFHLIQGPPGTGKTETIAQLAKLLLEKGKKIFITGPTHTAINNCLNSISSKVQDKSKLIKIGENYQAIEISKDNHITRKTRLPFSSYLSNNDLSRNGIIIGGTPHSLCYPASQRLDNWQFDVALIDEAAQMSIPLAISVMSKSDKFIFVGDHKQLDPIMPSNTNNSMFSESVFSRLVRLYPNQNTLLNISYRLNQHLIRIPNHLFYKDQLKADVSLKNSSDKLICNKYAAVLNSKDPKILYLHKEFDAKGRSPHEANLVSEMVNELVNNNIRLKNIGILTPYRAQVREIRKYIDKKIGILLPCYREELFIDTVDRMQGQERDYIIYSMSNSNPLESKRRLDFFYSPNRLNVAITRGIKRCIVIANYKIFDIIEDELADLPNYNNLKSNLRIFKEYYKLSTKVEEIKDKEVW